MATPAARRTRQQARGDASRQDILDAAARLMSAKGYDGTSMSDLATESGLPTSSIYWHFASKEGVLAAVMERGAERFFADLPTAADLEAERRPRARVRLGLRRASEAIAAHPEFLRIFILLVLQSDGDRSEDDVVHRVREEGRRLLRSIVLAAYADETPRVAARIADRLVDFAQGMFDGAFIAVQYDPTLSHTKLMEQMADAIVALGDQLLPRRARR